MAGQNKASFRKRLRSGLANKAVADSLISTLVLTQNALNSALDKLNAEVGAVTPAVAATAVLDLAADITLTSVAAGTARNTTTFTLQVAAAAANPTNTILASFTGSAAAIVCTITPNDGTNNAATPVDLTTAQLATLITTGVVSGVTITDASSLRALQTATGGDTEVLADAGEGDGVAATFTGGLHNSVAGMDVNYVSTKKIAAADLLDADADPVGDQYKSTMRKAVQSALAHRRLANELLDGMEEVQVAYNAMLVKLDAEAGALNDGNYASLLSVAVIDTDGAGISAQHKASLRRSLRSALAHTSAADELIDALAAVQTALNSTLVALDTGTINGTMAALKVTVLDPDSEG